MKASLVRREWQIQELSRNTIECHASSVATPWSVLGCCDRPCFRKNIRDFHATSWRSGKSNNCSVEMRLGVTGAL